jgi:Kef-type K+ transport system membrane component KefB/nucleotide-binding universal stress UspA family protein
VFPITDPVLIVAVAMAIFLAAPIVMRQVRLPAIIGLIIAGAIVGPNGLNLLARDQTIVLLGTVGLLYLIFLAGIEIDLHGFRRYRNRSLSFGAISYLLPQLIGFGVFVLLGYPVPAAVLIGSMFGSHTLLSYPIAIRFGIAKNRAVTTAVGGTIVTDTTALLVLAVVAASTQGALDARFWLTLGGSLLVYMTLVWYGLPLAGRWFFRNEQITASAEYVFVLTALFGGAFLAGVAGLQPIVGAFLTGLALNRLIPEGSALTNRLHFFGESFFIPFFLLSVGMLVDVRVLLAGPAVWLVMIGMSVTVSLTKALAALASARLFRYTRAEAWTMYGLSVPQAAATLAATLIGVEVGLFDEAVLNGAVLMILVTCIIGPAVLARFGREVALADEQRPLQTGDLPQRIIVPMANPKTATGLLDLALFIREPNSHEPIYPLMVVPGEVGRSAEHVALAEKMLGEATAYVTGSDVPVITVTRVEHNFAKGIARAIEETRTTTVVIGWDGRPSLRRGVFGSVLDQLLERTRQEILVAKLGHPLNTTDRLVVLIPAGSDHVPGFFESTRSIKLMASRLSARIEAYAVDTAADTYERHFEAVRPETPLKVTRVASWPAALATLVEEVGPSDLVVVLSGRRGALSWHPELDRLPGQLGALVPKSFVMIYPAERTAPSEIHERGRSDSAIVPERVVNESPTKLEDALDTLLTTHFSATEARRIRNALLREWPRAMTELRGGAVVLHRPIRGIVEPLTFLACTGEGIALPGVETPARLLFVLLSTFDGGDEHLRHLEEITRIVGDPARVAELQEAATAEDVMRALPRW